MDLNNVIDFFKEQGLYNEEYFKRIQENTKIYNKPYDEIKDFVGCYPIYNENNEIVNFKLILPKINDIYDVLIYIHEYTHALFIEKNDETLPNLMEALYINKYCSKKIKREIVKKTKREIIKSKSLDHKIAKKIKIKNII